MAFLKQDTYEKALTKKVDDIKLASDRFAEAAKICSYQKQRVLHREVRQNRTEVKQNRVIIERTRSESAQHYDSLDHAVRTEAKQIKTDMEVRLAKLESNNESKNNELKNTMKETMKSTIDDLLQNFFSSNERIDRKTHDRNMLVSFRQEHRANCITSPWAFPSNQKSSKILATQK